MSQNSSRFLLPGSAHTSAQTPSSSQPQTQTTRNTPGGSYQNASRAGGAHHTTSRFEASSEAEGNLHGFFSQLGISANPTNSREAQLMANFLAIEEAPIADKPLQFNPNFASKENAAINQLSKKINTIAQAIDSGCNPYLFLPDIEQIFKTQEALKQHSLAVGQLLPQLRELSDSLGVNPTVITITISTQAIQKMHAINALLPDDLKLPIYSSYQEDVAQLNAKLKRGEKLSKVLHERAREYENTVQNQPYYSQQENQFRSDVEKFWRDVNLNNASIQKCQAKIVELSQALDTCEQDKTHCLSRLYPLQQMLTESTFAETLEKYIALYSNLINLLAKVDYLLILYYQKTDINIMPMSQNNTLLKTANSLFEDNPAAKNRKAMKKMVISSARPAVSNYEMLMNAIYANHSNAKIAQPMTAYYAAKIPNDIENQSAFLHKVLFMALSASSRELFKIIYQNKAQMNNALYDVQIIYKEIIGTLTKINNNEMDRLSINRFYGFLEELHSFLNAPSVEGSNLTRLAYFASPTFIENFKKKNPGTELVAHGIHLDSLKILVNTALNARSNNM